MARSSKGSAFEREVCKQLSLWWTGGGRDDVFWRASNSGGRATVRGKQGKGTYGQYGDVAATDPIGEPLLRLITFELKRGYSKVGTVHDLLDRDKQVPNEFQEFFAQAIAAHKAAGSFAWALITKRDRRRAVIWIPVKLDVKLADIEANDVDWLLPTVRVAVHIRYKRKPRYLSVIGLLLEDSWYK